MNSSRALWRARKPLRDFFCALVVFSALFAAMTPSRHSADVIPIISLFSSSASPFTSGDGAVGTLANLGGSGLAMKLPEPALSEPNTPLISSLLAVVFSSITAFNFALLRYLRRVNASSWHRAWRDG